MLDEVRNLKTSSIEPKQRVPAREARTPATIVYPFSLRIRPSGV